MRTCTFNNQHNTECCTECGNSISLCQCVDPDQIAYQRLTSADGLVFMMMRDELEAARVGSPKTTHLLPFLGGKLGELAMLLIQHDHTQGTSVQEILRAAVQVAAGAVRIAVEGDENFMYEFPIVEEELPSGPVGRTYD